MCRSQCLGLRSASGRVELLLHSLAKFFELADLHQLLLITPDPTAAREMLAALAPKVEADGHGHAAQLRELVMHKVVVIGDGELVMALKDREQRGLNHVVG